MSARCRESQKCRQSLPDGHRPADGCSGQELTVNTNVDPDGVDGLKGAAGLVNVEELAVGTASWVQRTSGRLTTAERRALLRPLARTHLSNAAGRIRLALGAQPG